MGVCELWSVHLSRVLWETQRSRSSHQVSYPPTHTHVDHPPHSFVRSVTMDKWKDSEVQKMQVVNCLWCVCVVIMGCCFLCSLCTQVGGNSRAQEFLSSQSDITADMSLSHKYSTRGAALYRDKVSTYTQVWGPLTKPLPPHTDPGLV